MDGNNIVRGEREREENKAIKWREENAMNRG
jgi:hypothetical protein